jgi:hypothetical protein
MIFNIEKECFTMTTSIVTQSFGIHTFMITAALTFEKYRKLKLILQKDVYKKRESDNESYIKSKYFMTIGYYGIYAKLYMQNEFARLEIIVNPSNFLQNEYNQAALFSDTSKCKSVVNKLGQALNYINMNITMFTLSRIDLCANFKTTPAITEAYIKLGRKSYKSYNMNELTFDNESEDLHSLTLRCPSFELEIYDKEYEISKRTQNLINDSYGNILRIETRLSRDTIYRYNSLWKCADFNRLLKNFIYRKEDILLKCMERSFRNGAYMTLQESCILIDSLDYKRNTKCLMKKILKAKTDPDTALTKMRTDENLSEKKIQRIQSKFERCNLSMVTIPVRMADKCGDILPGFIELIKDEIYYTD